MAKVYHLLDEAEVFSERNGGAISRWAANVLRDGAEIIICPSYDSSWGFPVERIYQLPNWSLTDPVHPILYRLPWILQKPIYLEVFRALLDKVQKGDVVYVHNRPECASVLSTVAQKHGIHIVLHMHNSHLLRANRGQLKALKKTLIVFCSEFLRREVNAALPGYFDKTHVVYNGADDRKFQFIERSSDAVPTVVFTGRLVPYKGVHVLLEAMRILEKRGTRVKCTIAGGSGFGNSRTTRYVRKLHRLKPANTEMVGYKSGDALAEILRTSDIFCCPSIWNDPFPLAPLEAMATGLPVVASDTGGLPETLAYGGGIMVPPKNPMALADALEKLVNNAPLRRKMGDEARAAFKNHYLWQNVRKQYQAAILDYYREVSDEMGASEETWQTT
jgi:spore coat protein SA